MRDYRLPIMHRPVEVVKVKEIPIESNKKDEIIDEKPQENIIILTLTDSVGLKESFGG